MPTVSDDEEDFIPKSHAAPRLKLEDSLPQPQKQSNQKKANGKGLMDNGESAMRSWIAIREPAWQRWHGACLS